MEKKVINLSEEEFLRLNKLYPSTEKSSNVGKRSEELVKYYFRCLDENYQFQRASKGADIKVILGKESFEIEVKGTAKGEIAWNQLKVSGSPSHDRLENGLQIYRVISVYDIKPIIYILNHNTFANQLE